MAGNDITSHVGQIALAMGSTTESLETRAFVETKLDDMGVLTVRLRRPEKRNALCKALLAELKSALLISSANPLIRLVLLIGEGDRAFAAGGDLTELMSVRSFEDALAFSRDVREVLDSIRNHPSPVIAALNGDALGGGAELAVACDLRVAAAHARIGFLQARLAISTAWGGGADLIRLVGAGRALQLLISAETLDAGQALKAGLVDQVIAAEGFADAAREHVAQFAKRPPQVLRAIKALLIAARRTTSNVEAAEVESVQFANTWTHRDHWAALAGSKGPG